MVKLVLRSLMETVEASGKTGEGAGGVRQERRGGGGRWGRGWAMEGTGREGKTALAVAGTPACPCPAVELAVMKKGEPLNILKEEEIEALVKEIEDEKAAAEAASKRRTGQQAS